MEKFMVIMQGLPGSGKSTLAEKIENNMMENNGVVDSVILSTDDYFMVDEFYIFDIKNIGAAHAWNKRRCHLAVQDDVELIIIDNTNIRAWEARDYVKMGVDNGYEIVIQRADNDWSLDVDECFERCTHGVPKEVIQRMKDNMEDIKSMDIDVILQSKTPWEN